jgi:hypothetical protein
MVKHLIASVLFVAVFALPTFAASPQQRYQAALDLLLQSEAAAEMAFELSANPDDSAHFAVQTISFARQAAQDAVDNKGGTARGDAQAGAQTAYIGSSLTATLAVTETNSAAADDWLAAADLAYQAAFLLDKGVAK